MRKSRVIVLSDYIGGEGASSGGAGHAALDSYRALRVAGVDVRIVAGFGDAPSVEADRFLSLGGHDLRTGGVEDHLRTIYNQRARTALAATLAGEDPDTTLIIIHQWTRYLSPAALALTDRFATMIYMHDYFWACPNGLYYDFVAQRPCDRQPMARRCLMADCDRQGRVHKAGRVLRQAVRQTTTRTGSAKRLFLHLSAGALRTAAPLLPREYHAILHNPLPLPGTHPAPVPTPSYDVGYFGRLESDKGVGLLVEVVAREGLKALFVGEGSLEPLLDAVSHVERRAWQTRDSMAEAMRSCAIVVLPSLWHETWGLIIAEAMASGVAVLVSDRAGSAELVVRFGGGSTFDPDRPGDLAAKIASMLRSPPAPTRMQHELRTFLSPARHAASIIALAQDRLGLDLLADPPIRDRSRSPISRPV